MDSNMHRRDFLHTSAAAGVAVGSASLRQAVGEEPERPQETIRVAVVGPGGRGLQLLNECMEHGRQFDARVVAVCDIWNRRRAEAAARVEDVQGQAPKAYRRIEEVCEDADIDAVIIATPDHQHGQMLKWAVEAGKDVYCEKPMANNLADAKAALASVQASESIVQIGTQRRSDARYRSAAAIMGEQGIGSVVKIDMVWNAYSPYRWAAREQDLASIRAADTDWSAFLMGKQPRPFDPRIYRSFRLFRDFSSGIIDQWMSHGVDVIHWLSGANLPVSVVAQGGVYQWRDYRENPDTLQVLLEYQEGDQRFLANYSTNLVNAHGSATHVLGTHGTLEVEDVWRVSGAGSRRKDAVATSEEIREAPEIPHHMANWLDCVRRRDRAGLACPAEAGYGHSVACIMSTEAYWSGRRATFDAETQQMAMA